MTTETADQIAALNAANVHDHKDVEVPFVVVPSDHRVSDLEHLMPAPRRVRKKATITTADSFIKYADRFRTPASIIHADMDRHTFVAVLDHHKDADSPAWGDHTATYSCPLSRQWQAWKEVDGNWLDQEAFALFLEDRVADVTEPSGAQLLEMALNFKAIKKATFGASQNLSNGEFSVQYSEENQRGTVELPQELTLAVPVYRGDAAYKVGVRLRHRVSEGKLRLRMDLVTPDAVEEDAFNHARKTIAEQLPDVLVIDAKA